MRYSKSMLTIHIDMIVAPLQYYTYLSHRRPIENTAHNFKAIIIMDISMAHDPMPNLGHNALYRKMQKNL